MKLFSLHYVDSLKRLENNHKEFCMRNNIEFNKVIIERTLPSKYSFVLQQLQKNIGETLIFIDSYTFFNTLDLKINFNIKNILIQQTDKYFFDNFFVVKSNKNTINLYSKLYKEITERLFSKRDLNSLNIRFPNDFIVDYGYKENDQYFNVRINFANDEEIKNSLAINVDSIFEEERGLYFGEAIYASNAYEDLEINLKPYECFNDGHKKAFVMLYEESISCYATVSEKSVREYCLNNDITFYVYRSKPEKYKRMVGSWVKPYVLLNHIDKHEQIAWIDADILIGKDFVFNFEDDISVFNDPSNWFFNSGFMIFKNCDKNKLLLNNIICKIEKLNDLSGVYSNGGDQSFFIEEVKNAYPAIVPYSSNLANSHPVFPSNIDPKDKTKLIHFMGFKHNVREKLIKGFFVIQNEKE